MTSMRVKRSNPSCRREEWMASSLTLLAMTVKVTLTLRTVVGAALTATIAENAYARDPAGMLSAVKDEAGQVFQRGMAEACDLVEQLVVEGLLHVRDGVLEQAEIEHHSACQVRCAAHRDLGAEGMAVDLFARRAQCRARQRMRRFEPERFRQFPHLFEKPVLSDADCLVCLKAEPPLRVAQAIIDRARGVGGHIRTVHRLKREALEGEAGEIFRRCTSLRVDKLQFMPAPQDELGAGLRADADPVEARGRIDGAVGLDRDRKAAGM